MGADRLRVLVLALVSVSLIIASTLVLDWFEIRVPMPGFDKLAIDLRSVHACRADGVCGSAPMSMLKGLYPTLSTVTLWSSIALAVLVLFQAGTRVLAEGASHGLSKLGYMFGSAVFLCGFATAYFFGPDVGSAEVAQFGISIHVERSWAPVLLLLGDVVGLFTLHAAISYDTGTERIVPVTLAEARVVPSKSQPPAPERMSSKLPKLEQPYDRPSAPITPSPDQLRNKLKFATLAAELTRGGVDARREDGSAVLVMWRDVVGVVARRLPATYDSATFIDLVSSAGSTLRILPWTRLTGDPLGGDGEVRGRAFVELVMSRCPDAKLDPATRAFIETKREAAQLPDVATLAVHDERLS